MNLQDPEYDVAIMAIMALLVVSLVISAAINYPLMSFAAFVCYSVYVWFHFKRKDM